MGRRCCRRETEDFILLPMRVDGWLSQNNGQRVPNESGQLSFVERRPLCIRLVGLAETEDQAKYGRDAADGQAHKCRCGGTFLAVEECEAEDRGDDQGHHEHSQEASNDHRSRRPNFLPSSGGLI